MYVLAPYAPGSPAPVRGRSADRRRELAATGRVSANPPKSGAPIAPHGDDRDDPAEPQSRERPPLHEDGARISSETQAALLELVPDPDTPPRR